MNTAQRIARFTDCKLHSDIAIIITTKCAICGGKVEEREVSEEVELETTLL